MNHGIQWSEHAPSRQSWIGGVKRHNMKRNYLSGKSRAYGREASNRIWWNSFN